MDGGGKFFHVSHCLLPMSLCAAGARHHYFRLAALIMDAPRVVSSLAGIQKVICCQCFQLRLLIEVRVIDRFPGLEAAWPGIAPALRLFLAGDNARLQTACNALRAFLNFQGRWDELSWPFSMISA